MKPSDVVEHYIPYIKEEYRDDFVNGEIKFNAKEFENFSRYIMMKALNKFREENKLIQ